MEMTPDFIFLLKASGILWCTKKALNYICKIADDNVIEKLKKELFPDVKNPL